MSRGLLGVISLFGFKGLATSPIAKSDTETGTGVDAETLEQAITGTEVGVGVEGAGTIEPSLPDADVGIGTEGTPVLAVILSDSDTGTGVEFSEFLTSVQVPGTDVGTGAESSTLTITLSDSDSGVGVDTESLAVDRHILVVITAVESYRTIEYTSP